jgi:hypothetical protein
MAIKRALIQHIIEIFRLSRGNRVHGGHLREMQDKIETVCEVENFHKRAFSLKGVLLKYAV